MREVISVMYKNGMVSTIINLTILTENVVKKIFGGNFTLIGGKGQERKTSKGPRWAWS